jgi:DNA-binding CsgD family transcriptional regulator
MLTVRGTFVNGRVVDLEEVPSCDKCEVLVTFLLPDDQLVLIPQSDYEFMHRAATRERVALTDRECDVLAHMRRGLTNKEIAIRLQLSEGTVRNYTSRIYQKLDVRNRTEAVTLAAELGLGEIPPSPPTDPAIPAE